MPKSKRIETRDRYRIFSPVTTRWKDNDVYGHVNNAVYNAWMDTAVTDFFQSHWPGVREASIIPVAAETLMTFHRSIVHPAEVETGMRVDRIGGSSICCGVGIFLRGEVEAAAWGHMIHVWVDRESNQPMPMSDDLRRRFESAIVDL